MCCNPHQIFSNLVTHEGAAVQKRRTSWAASHQLPLAFTASRQQTWRQCLTQLLGLLDSLSPAGLFDLTSKLLVNFGGQTQSDFYAEKEAL